ncbi:MAG: YtxH domain-containing protein [Chloroflexaceae bacterium]|nr:YtxH domain-containing protein [Chloroflexaceae bacterium]
MPKKRTIDPPDTPYTIVVQAEEHPRPLMIGLLLGAVAGGLAAWLFAPRNGPQLREELTRTATTAQDSVKEQLYKAQTTVRSVTQQPQP